MQMLGKLTLVFLSSVLAVCLTGCASTVSKLEEIGKTPSHTAVEDPTRKSNYEPLSWPLPETKPEPRQYANSLWQPGARAFFRDQRAARVGDILRVNININDKAELKNQTQRQRDTTENLTAPAVAGLAERIWKPLPGEAEPANLFNIAGGTNSKGTGNTKREEKVNTQVAALITQVLPNGNFVIEGSQEININFDQRQVGVKGVVRPQDIGTDNTVDLTQIAEARITYSGKGQLTDMQQPRWGQQVIETLSPF